MTRLTNITDKRISVLSCIIVCFQNALRCCRFPWIEAIAKICRCICYGPLAVLMQFWEFRGWLVLHFWRCTTRQKGLCVFWTSAVSAGVSVRGDPQSTEGLRKWGHVDSQKLFEKLIKTVANFQDFFPLDCFMLVWPVFFLILENKKTYLGGSFRRWREKSLRKLISNALRTPKCCHSDII
jgi:hypothetical protein